MKSTTAPQNMIDAFSIDYRSMATRLALVTGAVAIRLALFVLSSSTGRTALGKF